MPQQSRSADSPAASVPFGHGVDALHDPIQNKGTAFTESEREVLGLRGLLPPRVQSQSQQVSRVLENLRRKPSNLEKYVFLTALQDRNETVVHRVVQDHLLVQRDGTSGIGEVAVQNQRRFAPEISSERRRDGGVCPQDQHLRE